MLPYLQWSVSHPQDSEDPTVSPVPTSVNGTVQLLVYNNASYAITARMAALKKPYPALLLACCCAVKQCPQKNVVVGTALKGVPSTICIRAE